MFVEVDHYYETLGYVVMPDGCGAWELILTANHEPYHRYSSCDKDYLKILGNTWESTGHVLLPEND